MGKILIGIVALLLLFAFSGDISDASIGLRTDETTEAFVVTTSGITSANVTLANDIFHDDLQYITSVTSSNSTETPLATTYTTATNKLLLTSLNPTDTRTITVNFKMATIDPVWGALGGFLLLLIIGGSAALIIAGMRSRRN
jgi:hypothetical protein